MGRVRRCCNRYEQENEQYERSADDRSETYPPCTTEIDCCRDPDHSERDDPLRTSAQTGHEPREVLVEQYRIDRHVHQRVHPRPPAILKCPEWTKGVVHPAVIAAFLGQHAG